MSYTDKFHDNVNIWAYNDIIMYHNDIFSYVLGETQNAYKAYKKGHVTTGENGSACLKECDI